MAPGDFSEKLALFLIVRTIRESEGLFAAIQLLHLGTRRARGRMTQAILSGLRVIDLTQNVAGPFCTQVLGDLGAEIIKVERPRGGDDTRAWTPPSIGDQSATFVALNRNKSSIAVDFDSEAGRQAIIDLAARADIFVHSLKPGSMEKRRLGWEDLRAVNGRLVYCSMSAFGSSGPLGDLPGYDPLMQAFTGVMSTTGNEGEDPVRVGVSLIDIGTGMWSVIGIISALLRRQSTGVGSNIEASLLDTGIGWMSIFVSNYVATGQVPRKMGSAMAMTAPYELFKAADGSVFIAAGNDRLFSRVCAGLGCPQLAADSRFLSNPNRVANREALHAALEERTCTRTVAENLEILRSVGAPCSELNSVAQMIKHEQVLASKMLMPIKIAGGTEHQVVALPIRIDGSRGSRFDEPPTLGRDSERVLREIGYDAARVQMLRDTGVVG